MVAEPRRQRSTTLRGAELLNDPLLNKGTAFSRAERRDLGLEALLPWQVETIEAQVERCRLAFGAMGSDLERYAYLQTLRERNVTLFHRFLADHIELAMPIVYTPTVGQAIQHFSHTYRSPSQGIYLAAPQQDRLEQLLAQACGGCTGRAPALLLVTDAQGILGIGDQGVGGIQICQGKLAVYTLCAGLDPARGLPVMLDVGTDRPELLADPCYPGLRQSRLQGEAYTAFLDGFITAVQRVCPGALVHWEDFGASHARPVLEAYRHRVPSFNDDIQGTSSVAAAAILAGLRGLGQQLADQQIVIFGAGSAGCGIAERLWRLLQRGGLTAAEAADRLWLIDRDGLIHAGSHGLADGARPFAKSPDQLAARFGAQAGDGGHGPGLQAVIEAVRPGVLIGTSTAAGAFDQAVVEALCSGGVRPIVLPLSNPTHLAEITPDNLLRWSQGRALVATGSPFASVTCTGSAGQPIQRVIGQCNNCFVFPGLGYGAVAVGATEVSDAMIDASIEALARVIPAASDPEAPLMPPLSAVQAVSQAVAEAVAIAAVQEGLARRASTAEDARSRLEDCRWSPAYAEILACDAPPEPA
ncbi:MULTISPECIES: NAD-dependent malic enzyme [unclassified Cyanobium]|uniref:NAD-dependent malic enzyme n=1 Tax=unclassified Cyanobium TaxID=2627006 RepID=UPI0020CDB74D|nr:MULTISPECIES: NAD-dependent malic enzyme [unclassified Cyanobium]MCP9832994.1 NAD-dependent malic enzyme [Cyanobium sp. La Preciosa 7G6]MCP9935744.1 NAD-dependent malic enzyme [Cyanobium sp. Aljojuca 7A6]